MRIAWLVSDLADMGLTCRVIIDSSIKNGWLRCVSGIHAQFASPACTAALLRSCRVQFQLCSLSDVCDQCEYSISDLFRLPRSRFVIDELPTAAGCI